MHAKLALAAATALSSDFRSHAETGAWRQALAPAPPDSPWSARAEAAGDDILLDLGGAAEVLPSQRCNRMPSATGIDPGAADGSLARQLKWVADSLSAIAGG